MPGEAEEKRYTVSKGRTPYIIHALADLSKSQTTGLKEQSSPQFWSMRHFLTSNFLFGILNKFEFWNLWVPLMKSRLSNCWHTDIDSLRHIEERNAESEPGVLEDRKEASERLQMWN